VEGAEIREESVPIIPQEEYHEKRKKILRSNKAC
jgi:hypothetical protein